MIQVFGPDRMRVQLEAGEVGHPHERGRVTRHDLFGGAAGRKPQRDRLDVLRTRRGRALLIEELAGDPVRIADQHVRPAARRAQGAVGHRDVVARQIEFRVTGLGEQHLARVRDHDVTSGDGQDLAWLGCGHALG